MSMKETLQFNASDDTGIICTREEVNSFSTLQVLSLISASFIKMEQIKINKIIRALKYRSWKRWN